MPTQFDNFSSDSPLENPDNDLLGYRSFAEHLARRLTKSTQTDGLVVAINGSWGSGKTTLLKFVEHHIGDDAIIIWFNPWWFSGQENLLYQFFNQIEEDLGKHDSKLAEAVRNISRQFAKPALEIIGEIISAYLPGIIGKIFTRSLSGLINQDTTLDKLKDNADQLFSDSKRIIIFIDDIDRLAVDEIQQIFSMTKAVANFDNVIYVLAFDKKIVVDALKHIHISGEEYLEKIIQIPLTLPLPEGEAILNMLHQQLQPLIVKTAPELFEQQRLQRHTQHIKHFIKTPRDVNRLMNAMSFNYPAVIDEVNFVDFLMIELIRIYQPHIYDIVRNNPDKFTGNQYLPLRLDRLLQGEKEEDVAFHKWVDEVNITDQDIVKSLFKELFPRLQSLWGNIGYAPDIWQAWRRVLRVCIDEEFETYFRLTIPQGKLTYTFIKEIISLTSNEDDFKQFLMGTGENNSTHIYLTRLQDHG